MVHDLNEECVHVKNTGFDLETIRSDALIIQESFQNSAPEKQQTPRLDPLTSLEE